jgi:hypothetical protein
MVVDLLVATPLRVDIPHRVATLPSRDMDSHQFLAMDSLARFPCQIHTVVDISLLPVECRTNSQAEAILRLVSLTDSRATPNSSQVATLPSKATLLPQGGIRVSQPPEGILPKEDTGLPSRADMVSPVLEGMDNPQPVGHMGNQEHRGTGSQLRVATGNRAQGDMDSRAQRGTVNLVREAMVNLVPV